MKAKAKAIDMQTRALEIADNISDNSRRAKYAAQSFLIRVALEAGMKISPRHIAESIRVASELTKIMVENGKVSYAGAVNEEGYYYLKDSRKNEDNGVVENWRMPKDSIHYRATEICVMRGFKPNAINVREAENMLNNDRVFVGGKWMDRTAFARRHEDPYTNAIDDIDDDVQGSSFDELLNIQKWMIKEWKEDPEVRMFGMKMDDRGRRYFLGGFLSPHNGRFARWMYTHDGEITFDHRTSFAQMITLLTGDAELGKHVGLGTDNPSDFYVGIAEANGIQIDRHGIAREAMKRAIMPACYGAGERRSRAGFEAVYKAADMEPNEELWAVVEKYLKTFQHLQVQTRTFAKSFADEGENPEWTTPSGFTAKKDYWVNRSVLVTLDTDTSNLWYRPQAIRLSVPTKIVSTQTNSETGQKSVIVATMANIIQSLDAALLSMVIVKFYEETGEALYPIHDSYTVKKEHAATLKKVVCQCMRDLAKSEEMQNLRKELLLPPVRIQTGSRVPSGEGKILDLRKMNPLEEE